MERKNYGALTLNLIGLQPLFSFTLISSRTERLTECLRVNFLKLSEIIIADGLESGMIRHDYLLFYNMHQHSVASAPRLKIRKNLTSKGYEKLLA